jgi:two-component SAPR family response regulator
MARLCVKALETGIETEYVKHLIRKYNLFPDTPPLELEEWPWKVRVFTLGRFGLETDGKPARSSKKAQKKPLEMLKALIAFGGRDVSEDEIIDVLWPEAEGDTAQQSFRTTLHRLRKLLGNENAVQSHQEAVSINQHLCWVDTWAFERLIDLSDAAAGKGQTDKAIQYCKKAIEMYKGHFLIKEHEYSWAIPNRERLRGMFLNHIERLGSCWEDSGQYKKAVECYQKALEVDDLAEEVYQRIMKCYQKLGLRAEALAAYKRCCRSIKQVFGVGPSPETETIYKSILSDR